MGFNIKSVLIVVLTLLIILMCFIHFKYRVFDSYFLSKNETIYINCRKHMKNNTCSIMAGPETQFLAADAKTVLIAGFGDMNIELYRGLRNNPIFMCEHIKTACSIDSGEEMCRLGTLLYSK